MKRIGGLFDRIASRENLRLAFFRAKRSKRGRPDVEMFAADLEANLLEMAGWLKSRDFPLGRYSQFKIRDPKPRIITAPCFAERVLHHAVMNVCEPHFDRFLIADTFACRRGLGRIRALRRALVFSGRYALAVKLDMRSYFHSIPHQQLHEKLARRFKDRRLLDLFLRIIHSHKASVGRGLPIGSLTSQHFANFYLGHFDRFVKESLRVPGYLRYMDDCVLWADGRRRLRRWTVECDQFLNQELDLACRANPVAVVRHGLDFLGCRVFPNHLKLNRRSRRRFRRKLRDLVLLFSGGHITSMQLQQRVTSLVAFTRAAEVKSWTFRSGVLQQMMVSGQWA